MLRVHPVEDGRCVIDLLGTLSGPAPFDPVDLWTQADEPIKISFFLKLDLKVGYIVIHGVVQLGEEGAIDDLCYLLVTFLDFRRLGDVKHDHFDWNLCIDEVHIFADPVIIELNLEQFAVAFAQNRRICQNVAQILRERRLT